MLNEKAHKSLNKFFSEIFKIIKISFSLLSYNLEFKKDIRSLLLKVLEVYKKFKTNVKVF